MLETNTGGRPRVALETDALRHDLQRRGYYGHNAQSAFMGVSPSSWSKIGRGKERPSADFIAAVLATFPRARFSRFFRVERTSP